MTKPASSAPFDRSNLDELPYMPLWVLEHLGQTALMDLAQRGAYVGLLLLCWMSPGCKLPREHARIRAELRVSEEDYDHVVRPLLLAHFPVTEGYRTNRKLKQLYKKQSDLIRNKVAAGRAGGNETARRRKEKSSSSAVDLLSANSQQRPSKLEQKPELESKLASPQLVDRIQNVMGPGAAPEINRTNIERVASSWLGLGATEDEIVAVIERGTAQPRNKPIRSLAALEGEIENTVKHRRDLQRSAPPTIPKPLAVPINASGRDCLNELVSRFGPRAVEAWFSDVIWLEDRVLVRKPHDQQHIDTQFGGLLSNYGFSVGLQAEQTMH